MKSIEEQLPGVQKNVSLKEYTTFAIGGPAEYFFVAQNANEVKKAIRVATELGLPVVTMGGGSNLLIFDQGLRGLVIKIHNTEISVTGTAITAGAGVEMKDLVQCSLDHGLEGLEWAGGLPGTFGGAIRGNAGAFGGEMKDTIFQVEALDEALVLHQLDNQQCQFGYRNSIVKRKGWIVLSATVHLKPGDKQKIQAIANSRIQYRKDRHPLEYPSAGSVFKNVDVKDVPAQFLPEFQDKIKQDPFPIVPAAWFIIGAGLTGAQVGQAQISTK